MVRKVCRSCGKTSYSLSRKGIWICPHCQTDLTGQPTVPLKEALCRVLPIRGEKIDSSYYN